LRKQPERKSRIVRAGCVYDYTADLIYNYFRDYDPQVGRYVESDPIGLEGGLNTYGYALMNPVTYVDMLGLAANNPYPLLPKDWDWIPKPSKPGGYPPPPSGYPEDQETCKRICDAMLMGVCPLQGNLLERAKCVVDWREWCMECTRQNACVLPGAADRMRLAVLRPRRPA
jgi:RHS repeat-associated protein